MLSFGWTEPSSSWKWSTGPSDKWRAPAPRCGATNTGGYPNPCHYIRSGVWPEGHLADDAPLKARVTQAIARRLLIACSNSTPEEAAQTPKLGPSAQRRDQGGTGQGIAKTASDTPRNAGLARFHPGLSTWQSSSSSFPPPVG